MSTESGKAGRRRWVSNILLLVGAVIFYGAVFELVLRAGCVGEPEVVAPTDAAATAGPSTDIVRPSADPVLEFELKPSANRYINAEGFWGPLPGVPKPEGTVRIVGLGDSITMYRTVENENYLVKLDEALAGGSRPVEVLNFGVGGYNTTQEVRTLELRGLKYEPDLVVVGYCLNDGFHDYFVFNAAAQRLEPALGTEKVAAEKARVDALLQQPDESAGLAILDFIRGAVEDEGDGLDREAFYELALSSEPWQKSMAGLDRLAELSKEHHFQVVVVVFPFLFDFEDPFFQPFHEAVGEKARSLGFGHIDLTEPFAEVGHTGLRGRPDDPDYVHPNARGHAIAADALAEWVKASGVLE